MSQPNSEEKFRELRAEFFRGKITRRRFIQQSARLGFSAALLSRMVSTSYANADNLVDSSPVAPNESPVTKERIEYLKSKPYKDVTINVMALRSAVGDCLEYHAPRWEEETGAHVNVTKISIETLHQQIFSGSRPALASMMPFKPLPGFTEISSHRRSHAIIEITPFLKDPKYPYWDPDQFLPAMKRLYTWQGKLYGVLFDADAQILYYRKDVLGNALIRRIQKPTSDMIYRIPRRNMKEMHDVASFFTGWDWNGDGRTIGGFRFMPKSTNRDSSIF